MVYKFIIGSELFEYDNYEDYLNAINQFKNPTEENTLNIEIAIDRLVSEKLSEYWYKDLSELSLIANTPESIWYNEANAIKKWYNQVYETFYNYKNTVDKDSMIEPEQFISSLPELIIE